MKAARMRPLLFLLAGCQAQIYAASGPSEDVSPETPTPDEPGGAFDLDALSPELTHEYLSLLAPPVASRALSPAELDRIEAEGGAAIRPVIEAWTLEAGLVAAARNLVSQRLSVSGTRDGIDFELPGNLAAWIVDQDLPWSTLLTATECRDASGAAMPCDTGAPYTAGVLTTRAYLASRAGRFNLTRASTLMRAFACRMYPIEDDLQPRIEKEHLIPMFRATTPDEQTDDRARGGFGNGFACYTCHGQFSLHAQLFVRFDSTGLWRADADGLQDPEGELGRSFDNLFASHMVDAAEARSERSQIFGVQVENLAEAARVVAESTTFFECAARNVLEYTLGVDPAVDVESHLLPAISERLRRDAPDPTFAAIVVETLADPRVVQATLRSVEP